MNDANDIRITNELIARRYEEIMFEKYCLLGLVKHGVIVLPEVLSKREYESLYSSYKENKQ